METCDCCTESVCLSVCLSVTDDGGVFKSRTVGGRVETRGASEVRDSRDTRTDLPLDYMHAQPVHVRTVHRLIGRYRRSKHRKFVITSKLPADEPLRQLTLSLTLALTFSHNFCTNNATFVTEKTFNR